MRLVIAPYCCFQALCVALVILLLSLTDVGAVFKVFFCRRRPASRAKGERSILFVSLRAV
jgi:hypothetical protein